MARVLIARGRPQDLDRALPMLEQAEDIAARMGGGLLTREAAGCRAAFAAVQPKISICRAFRSEATTGIEPV